MRVSKRGESFLIEGKFKNGELMHGNVTLIYGDVIYETKFDSDVIFSEGIIIGKKTFEGQVIFKDGIFQSPSPFTGKLKEKIQQSVQLEPPSLISIIQTYKEGKIIEFQGQDSNGGTWKGAPSNGEEKAVAQYTLPSGTSILQFSSSTSNTGKETYDGEYIVTSDFQILRHGKGIRIVRDENDEEIERFDGMWENHGIKEGKYTSKNGLEFDLVSSNDDFYWFFKDGSSWRGRDFDNGIYEGTGGSILSNKMLGKEMYEGSVTLGLNNGGTILKHGKGRLFILDDSGKEVESLKGTFDMGNIVEGDYKSAFGDYLHFEGSVAKGTLMSKDKKIEGEWRDSVLYEGVIHDLVTGTKTNFTPQDYQNFLQNQHAHGETCNDPTHHHHH